MGALRPRRAGAKALVGLALLASGAFARAPFKVLVEYGGNDGGHSPMPLAGKPVIEAMALAAGFTLEFSGDKAVLNDAKLAQVDVLVMINQYPFELTAGHKAAIQKFVEAGKGWVGIHSTGCAQPDWTWYSKLLGGTTWKGHANLRNGTLLIEDRSHPVTRNLPASFTLKEEWYEFNVNPRPNVNVLAKAGNTGNAGYDNADHPMVWTSPAYPKVVYISPGHDPSDWKVPEYVDLVRNAILWAAESPTPIFPRMNRGRGAGFTIPDARPNFMVDLAGRWSLQDGGIKYFKFFKVKE